MSEQLEFDFGPRKPELPPYDPHEDPSPLPQVEE